MSGSPDHEEALFEEALAFFKSGDLLKARDLFELVVLENGELRRRAEYYLAKIAEMTTRGRAPRVTRGGLGAAPPFEGGRGTVFRAGDEPVPGAESAPGPAAPQVLRRTPHMDLSETEPGTRFAVFVYADTQAFQEGESGEDVVIEAPPEQKRFEVDVWLTVGEPFAVEGPPVKRLVILRDQERSDPVEFTVARQEGPAPAEPVLISAFFSYRGRACGRVSRELIASQKPAKPSQEIPEPEVHIDATAHRPDLSVRIVANDGDGRVFDCIVETPLLSEYKDGVTAKWTLSSLASEFVKQKMAQFTAKNATPFGRTMALKGAGIEFFEAAPKLFRDVFWALIDRGMPLRTILIVTEEPSIPWELMVPCRDGDEDREPLGITYLVSRWTARNHVLREQSLPLRDAFVVAPSDSKLASAQSEVNLLLQQFPCQAITPASLQKLDESLQQEGRTLLHFICHGKTGEAGSQVLYLQNLEELQASQLRAMPGVKKALRTARPLVFLNACEVGRQAPALVGAGGFAEVFINLGASGVVAPLWSVKDSIAHEIAQTFYERIKNEPNTPFAEILADMRKLSYKAEGGEDTYAAYCFYGDPLAHRAP